jgi:hypothetical protein
MGWEEKITNVTAIRIRSLQRNTSEKFPCAVNERLATRERK